MVSERPGYIPVRVTLPARQREVDGLVVLPNGFAFLPEDVPTAVVVPTPPDTWDCSNGHGLGCPHSDDPDLPIAGELA